MKRIINCFLFLLLTNVSISQQYSGVLTKVRNDGLHVIKIPANVRSASNGNLDHIRILDSKKNEVPYAEYSASSDVLNLKTFKIIERNAILNKQTYIVVENPDASKLDRLLLKIANSSVTKQYNISGSNDNKQWFGLVYNQQVDGLYEDGQTSIDKEFLFPLNNYKYIRFEFNDKNSSPLNVLLASYFEMTKTEIAPSVSLTDFDFSVENDSKEKVTRIRIKFDSPQVINGIRFNIKKPNMFLREARILVAKTQTVKRQKEEYQETLSVFQLNSGGNNHFEFSDIFEKELIVEIDNQDNPALDIKSVELLQRPLSIVADLKKNEAYRVVIDSNYSKPNYDIVNFDLNPEKQLAPVEIESFEKLNSSKSSEKEGRFWQSAWFLWGSIIVGGMLIAYFAFGLLKDLEKKN
ncbi:hypothetical protein NAT51_14350 [Flavobacterium amniphilum]|uniref:hypothetical protein n=1 Tax=Flavobacterium amniphilum TaxID=1834035 RepID=UPI002029C64B|nr:hypothetical protein [Flavobacterium amniphilum]MCL9806711.1 hypothetical protein [Flavobacterium amniphilum]